MLRIAVPGAPAALLTGRRFLDVAHRAHFVRFALEGPDPALELVVAPMLAGRFALAPVGSRIPADLAVGLARTLGLSRA